MHPFHKFVGVATLGLLVLVAVSPVLPDIEGRLFPVIVDTEISVESAGELHTDIEGETTKVRHCDWIETVVWAGEPDRSMLLATSRPEGQTNFEFGRNPFGPIRIPLPIGLTGDVTAVTRHHCHQLWDTRTILFSRR